MASEKIKGICDGCSANAQTWVEQERTRIPVEDCNLIIYECQHCPRKDGYVDLTFDGCKIKYNVNPYYVTKWIQNRDIARNATESQAIGSATSNPEASE